MTRTIFSGDDTQKAYLISCSAFAFTISRRVRLGVRVGDLQHRIPRISWQCQLEERGIHGDYHVWLRNHGDKVVSRMNAPETTRPYTNLPMPVAYTASKVATLRMFRRPPAKEP
ncbi:hypothetical protein GB937_006539 [Aspergillus fischeri]|nr:hypothetical protein GB937_006539 [Aspergillus fischeri]